MKVLSSFLRYSPLLVLPFLFYFLNLNSPKVTMVFCPNCEKELMEFLSSAKQKIYIEMYELSSESVVEKLAELAGRGVKIRIATKPDERVMEAIKTLASIAEIKFVPEEVVPVSGKVFLVDGQEFVFGLTEGGRLAQELAFWSKSPYAASGVIEPLFNLLWQTAKPFQEFIGRSEAR
mgnify:CR=1 FL=1